MWTALILALGIALIVSRRVGFGSQRPAHYANLPGPAFDPRHHLNGPILCEGVI